MIPEKMYQVLNTEGVVAIATDGEGGLHLVNTWNSYVKAEDGNKLVIPVGGMNKTQRNIELNPRVLLTLGSREVQGKRGPGAGFLVVGVGTFAVNGRYFESVKERFPWARAALIVDIRSVEQTL